ILLPSLFLHQSSIFTLQTEKLIEMHMKLRQMKELNTVLKETSKLQDTFNATVLIGSAKEHFPPLTTDVAVPAEGRTVGSCSTPCPGEHPWKRVGDRGRLENRFTVLSPDSSPDRRLSAAPTSSDGDSIVRGLSLTSHGTTAAVHCFPGAQVLDLNTQLPAVLGKHCNVSTVVAHIDSNNTSHRESEILKEHFKTLISSLKATGKNIAISGPLPTHKRGIEKFSHLFLLNLWLKSICDKVKVTFIDNFDVFWGRPAFFNCDGLHPNHRGSQMLAQNIVQCISP
uniref:SGNH hydrolase-type esterase domain-containing protein n=1 Tax=Labrus bergylta TaxID=56723 RepID=A0A3Q3E0C6_9LABR